MSGCRKVDGCVQRNVRGVVTDEPGQVLRG